MKSNLINKIAITITVGELKKELLTHDDNESVTIIMKLNSNIPRTVVKPQPIPKTVVKPQSIPGSAPKYPTTYSPTCQAQPELKSFDYKESSLKKHVSLQKLKKK